MAKLKKTDIKLVKAFIRVEVREFCPKDVEKHCRAYFRKLVKVLQPLEGGNYLTIYSLSNMGCTERVLKVGVSPFDTKKNYFLQLPASLHSGFSVLDYDLLNPKG